MHEQTYRLIRLISDRNPGQPINLADVKAIGAVAMAEWTNFRLELIKATQPAPTAIIKEHLYLGGD